MTAPTTRRFKWLPDGGRHLAVVAVALVLAIMGSQPAAQSAGASAHLFISEVHASGSGNGTYNADWFEVTNTGTTAVDITGWQMDDNSNGTAKVALRGLASIPAGKSAVFFEGNATGSTDATIIANFSNAWFGSMTPPAGLLIGAYGGAGVGLSTSGDAVNLFDAAGSLITGVSFGAATATATFDNTAGLGSGTLPLPTITTLSVAGVNGAFVSVIGSETGSPSRTITAVDLSTYVRVGRFDLPEPTRTTPPANSVLAQEVSAVTYNWNTNTLFVVGDGGTSIVQVTKTGQLIDSMTLAPGGSPQGTDFYDPEGLTYVGGGKFVMSEERDRQAVLFTYAPGTTLGRSGAQTVKLGTFVENIGIEGISYDPQTGGFIAVKETQPQGIFQTNIDFAAGTASNGSPTTVNSTNLFDPALLGLLDFADVYPLSNLSILSGRPDFSHLLVLSQESGKILNVDRSGQISSSLTIQSDPGNPLSVAAQQHEGLTMDGNGFLYVVSENGGGDFDHPQLWVYAPSSAPNQPPTAVVLSNVVSSLAENTSTDVRITVADISIADDGLGTNVLTLSGSDASDFEVDSAALYLKAGTVLDFEAKTSYSVTLVLDDLAVGVTPDATAGYVLTVTDVIIEIPPPSSSLIISEVAPWSSGNSPIAADWFEVTNTGTSAVIITGWKMDDNSGSFAAAVGLNGINTIAPGESVIFLETANLAHTKATFLNTWFGANQPAGLQIGSYTGGGVGLSTGGDAVNLYASGGVLRASVSFGSSPGGPFSTFNNAVGLNNADISQLSRVGLNGAFVAATSASEIGSPGTIGKVFISEVAPWSSGDSPVGADWFEVTNATAHAVDLTGWKMDDSSGSPAAAVALNGITSIAPGESVIFIETGDLVGKRTAFLSNWFGANPVALQIGNYTGGGVGLSTGGDAVVLFDATGKQVAGVSFGTSTSGFSFDNAAGLIARVPPPTISILSVAGVNGAFLAANGLETGSPGLALLNQPPVANAGPDQTVEATGPGGASVTLNGSASMDPDGDTLTYTWTRGGVPLSTGPSPVVTLALGEHTLALAVSDGKAIASDTVRIEVRDRTSPTISRVAPSETQLWPPNNKMVPISVAVSATDLVNPSPACSIASVLSNEPGNGEWQVTGSLTLQLMASRNGNGNGRIYTIAVQCSDAAGNSASQSTTVMVPHDKGN